jgi:hypothetical protein
LLATAGHLAEPGDCDDTQALINPEIEVLRAGDRRLGHLYAAGGSSGTTMGQYTEGIDAWVQVPDLPADHSNNPSCLASATGKLYKGSGSMKGFYSLDLYWGQPAAKGLQRPTLLFYERRG